LSNAANSCNQQLHLSSDQHETRHLTPSLAPLLNSRPQARVVAPIIAPIVAPTDEMAGPVVSRAQTPLATASAPKITPKSSTPRPLPARHRLLKWQSRNQRVAVNVVFAKGASMSDFQSPVGLCQRCTLAAIQFGIGPSLVILILALSPHVFTQNAVPCTPPAPLSCPVQFLHVDPDGGSARIRNVSGNKIVGLVFNAVADATEHWKWLHWNFDDARPVQNFGWNKPIKAGDTKKLSWIGWT
jgi:hypothetical protein